MENKDPGNLTRMICDKSFFIGGVLKNTLLESEVIFAQLDISQLQSVLYRVGA